MKNIDPTMEIACRVTIEGESIETTVNIAKVFPLYVTKYYADGGNERFLWNAALTQSSIVVEVGGFYGDWSAKMHELYQPRLFVLEPVARFRAAIEARFAGVESVTVLDYGLGEPGEHLIKIDDDATSLFLPGDGLDSEIIRIKRFADLVQETGLERIDLMQINIEGAEFALMEEILDHPLLTHIARIQVQYHANVPDAPRRRDAIRARLAATHIQTFNFPWVWECWERKSA